MEERKQAVMVCVKGGTAEITESRSRFIATVAPVKSEEEALAFLAEVRAKHRDARHNCYAYITGEDGKTVKCSDDGEPSQTAGPPILSLLTGRNARDVCVVVTRYFGGILLGTGGLVRAYGKAAAEGLAASVLAEQKDGYLTRWELDYDIYGRVRYLAEREKLEIPESAFGEKVALSVIVPADRYERLLAEIRETSAGRAVPSDTQRIRYCMVDGKAVY